MCNTMLGLLSHQDLCLPLSLVDLRTLVLLNYHVYSSSSNMGSRSGKGQQGWLAPVLCTRYGCSHEVEIPVRSKIVWILSFSEATLLRRQVGQTSSAEVQKRDLRAELLLAEQEAKNKKRKAQGLPPLAIEGTPSSAEVPAENEEANKRRKLLQEALEMDKDSDDDDSGDEKDEAEPKKNGVSNGKAKANGSGDADGDVDMDSPRSDDEKLANAQSDSDDDSDSDEDEDDTAELLRELEKIKRERAEEKERVAQEQSASDAATRDAEIATANPLMNLAAALGQPTGVNTTVPGTFSVKKRWDDGMFSAMLFDLVGSSHHFPDVIFKNQAMAARDRQNPGFVNDLLRTEFHKKFMSKFIKVRTAFHLDCHATRR